MSEKGYVYILTNPSMPGLVKIGKTTRNVEQRANELYQTGVPEPFVVSYEVETPNCTELESLAHDAFRECRVNEGREFFRADTYNVARALDSIVLEQVSQIVCEYCPEYVLVSELCKVEECDIAMIANQIGVGSYVIAGAMGELTACEIEPAIARYLAKQSARIAARGDKPDSGEA